MNSVEAYDVVIVGGGPGGLAVSQQLGSRGVPNIVLEQGPHPGWMWSSTYDSLRLHTGRHLSSLPDMGFPRGTSLFLTRSEFTAYLESYLDAFGLPVQTNARATGLRAEGGCWTVSTDEALYSCRSVVVATGIMSSPLVPDLPNRSDYLGTVIHSRQYRRPEPFEGRRVVVVGIGNSAAEIASELAGNGVEVAVSVRSGANVVPRSIVGIPTQYFGWALSWLPRSAQQRIVRGTGRVGALMRNHAAGLPKKRGYDECPDVPVIGRAILEHIQAGRIEVLPAVEGFTRSGVRLSDGIEHTCDFVILATGYTAALEWMGDLAVRDGCGFAERSDRVRSTRFPGLYFVGHNYDGRGGLYNIRIDARRIAKLIADRHRR